MVVRDIIIGSGGESGVEAVGERRKERERGSGRDIKARITVTSKGSMAPRTPHATALTASTSRPKASTSAAAGWEVHPQGRRRWHCAHRTHRLRLPSAAAVADGIAILRSICVRVRRNVRVI